MCANKFSVRFGNGLSHQIRQFRFIDPVDAAGNHKYGRIRLRPSEYKGFCDLFDPASDGNGRFMCSSRRGRQLPDTKGKTLPTQNFLYFSGTRAQRIRHDNSLSMGLIVLSESGRRPGSDHGTGNDDDCQHIRQHLNHFVGNTDI